MLCYVLYNGLQVLSGYILFKLWNFSFLKSKIPMTASLFSTLSRFCKRTWINLGTLFSQSTYNNGCIDGFQPRFNVKQPWFYFDQITGLCVFRALYECRWQKRPLISKSRINVYIHRLTRYLQINTDWTNINNILMYVNIYKCLFCFF